MRPIPTICLVALAALTATGAPIPKEEKKVSEKLLGEWKLVKTDAPVKPEYTFTIHFKKDGALEFHRKLPDQDEANISKGKYKTAEPDAKNKLGTIDWTIGEGDDARGELSKIITLTDDELVFEDPDGLKESFVRVKPKKDEPKKDDPKKDEPKKDK